MSGIRGSYCKVCDRHLSDCMCADVYLPSPARSDKEAERALSHAQIDRIAASCRDTSRYVLFMIKVNAALAAQSPAGQAQESAPSSGVEKVIKGFELVDCGTCGCQVSLPVDYTVAPACAVRTWQQRLDEQLGRTAPHDGGKESAMLDEIADLRAALARRATAGNAAPTEARGCASCELPMHHDPALVEAYNQGYEAALASNTATTAPGDLPPLPKGKTLVGSNLESLHVLYSADQMEAYGRACIASNARAASGLEKANG